MKKSYLILLAIILLTTGFTLGCAIPQETQDVANAYFEAIKQKDFNKALGFYSPKFFEKTSQTEWLQALNNINYRLGDLQTYKLTSFTTTKYVGTGGNGTYYNLKYDVTYSKYSAVEFITLFKPNSGGDTLITGHNINSMGFLK